MRESSILIPDAFRSRGAPSVICTARSTGSVFAFYSKDNSSHVTVQKPQRILYNLYIRILEVDNIQQINIIHVIIHTISKMLCLHFRERA